MEEAVVLVGLVAGMVVREVAERLVAVARVAAEASEAATETVRWVDARELGKRAAGPVDGGWAEDSVR